MKTTKNKISLFAWIKERIRKFLVALKKNPQSVPIVMLTVAFLHYSLNLTNISDTTAKLQGRNMGLMSFVAMLFMILSFVCMLNAFPKRQKPKLSMIIVMIALYGSVIAADIYYLNRIMYATTRPDNPIKITEKTMYIYDAYDTVLINIVLIGLTILCILLEPVFAKLFKKIKTSIEVEGSGNIENIDISSEE